MKLKNAVHTGYTLKKKEHEVNSKDWSKLFTN